MRGLLYREFVQNKATLLLVAAVGLFLCFPLVMMVTPSSSPDTHGSMDVMLPLMSVFIYVCVYMLVGAMLENLFTPDENRLWHSFVMAAPRGVEEILWVKYEFLMIVFGITAAAGFFVDQLLSSLAGVYSSTAVIHMIGFFWLLFTASFDIPFLIRFGSKRGGIVKAFCILAVLLTAAVYALFGDISMFGSAESLYEFILGILRGELPKWCHVCLAVLPFLICGMYYISYRLSCKLYRKGADAYAE